MIDRVRLLNGTLRTWRTRAWKERRTRWAEDMRSKMKGMQQTVHRRILAESLLVSTDAAESFTVSGQFYRNGNVHTS